jgi:hypothetical protein
MKELAFHRIRGSRLMVATEGPFRYQLWEDTRNGYHGPLAERTRWAAAVFQTTFLGARRKTPDRFFDSQEAAVEWLAKYAEGAG